jgi:hypothetical protein
LPTLEVADENYRRVRIEEGASEWRGMARFDK